jgi:aryl-alcohol dehydrogenase-like predicted oxidoreductase
MGPLLPLLQAPGVPLIPLSPLSRKLLSSMRSKIHTPVVTIMQPHPNRATSRRLHRRVVPGA